MFMCLFEFGEIQKFSRLAEQADQSNNKYTVDCIVVQKKNQDMIVHFNHNVAASTRCRLFPYDPTMTQSRCHLYLIFHYPTTCMCIEALCIHVQ